MQRGRLPGRYDLVSGVDFNVALGAGLLKEKAKERGAKNNKRGAKSKNRYDALKMKKSIERKVIIEC